MAKFIIPPKEPTAKELEKKEREKRISDLKANPKSTYTNKDVMELLLDIADRQSEIYDKLNK